MLLKERTQIRKIAVVKQPQHLTKATTYGMPDCSLILLVKTRRLATEEIKKYLHS
jgi:hypothetical protein